MEQGAGSEQELSIFLQAPRSLLIANSAAVAGIEPASVRLTGARPYQHGPHRNRVEGRFVLS